MMRKLLLLLGAIAFASSASAQSEGDPNEGSHITHDAFNGTFNFSWWGRPGNTYFIQHSDDLMTWEYVPIIESGAGETIEWGFTSSANTFFLRLKYTDEPTNDPALADFDRDGVGNMDELEQGTDPFHLADSDSDGLPDDWETFHANQFAAYPSPIVAQLARLETTTAALILNNATGQNINYSVALLDHKTTKYFFTDSKSGDVPFSWEEISSTGTRLEVISAAENQASEPVTLSNFSFPFYGQSYSQMQVSSSGYLTFGPPVLSDENEPLPSASAPSLLVAPFWYDLDLDRAGDVYYKEETDRLIIQYQQVAPRSYLGNGAYTFQVVLFANGEIQFRYLTLTGDLTECTAGIQNIDGSDGLQVVHASAYLENNLAVRIRPPGVPFVEVSPASGMVSTGAQNQLEVLFRSLTLFPGTYTATIQITHDGPGANPLNIPAALNVSNLPSVVSIIDPPGPMTAWQGEGVYLIASATDPDTRVTGISFRAGATELGPGDFWEGNYEYFWDGAPGTHSIVARAVDELGQTSDSAPVLINILADADGDRMEDGWEVAHGLDPSFNDASADADGDGFTNREEYQNGTDPWAIDQPWRVLYGRPVEGETAVPVDKVIVAALDRPLDAGLANAAIRVTQSPTGEPVTGATVVMSGRQVLAFVPAAPLAAGKRFRATVEWTTAGFPVVPFTALFETAPAGETSKPFVMRTLPDLGNINVSPAVELQTLWSEPLDPATISDSVVVLQDSTGTQVPCSVSYDPYWYSLKATPQQPLPRGMQYTATVTTQVKNLRGVNMAAPYSWSFTVLPEDALPPASGPYLAETFPVNRYVEVSPEITLELTWSEEMEAASFTPESVQLIEGWSGRILAANLAYDPATKRLSIDPVDPLIWDTGYLVRLQGVRSATGVEFAGAEESALNFRTLAPEGNWSSGGGNEQPSTPGPGGLRSFPPSGGGGGGGPGGMPSPSGGTSPPQSEYQVEFSWGDESGSESESYAVEIKGGPTLEPSIPGQLSSEAITLSRLKSYEITLSHKNTKLEEGPDYDYTLQVELPPATTGVVKLDPDQLLGARIENDESFKGKKAHLLAVKLMEEIESGESAGCTGYDRDEKALMVPMQGSNKIRVIINASSDLLSKIKFAANAPGKLTIQPEIPTSSDQVLTLSGSAEALGVTIQLDINGTKTDLFEADVLKKLAKTIAIHAITEENDDFQVIPVGQGQPNQTCITAGANGVLNTTAVGDDTVSGGTITTGPNGICNTTASGDDVQFIPVGNGRANTTCVTKGANNFRDSKPLSDDAISGDDVNTGGDGVCNTTATTVNLVPATCPTAAQLQSYLNDMIWGPQANVHFTVTRSLHTVNYDLDRSGTLAHPSKGAIPNPAEGDAISAVAKDSSTD